MSVDISKYPEGLEYLAKNLDLPFAEDDMVRRKAAVEAMIANLLRQ